MIYYIHILIFFTGTEVSVFALHPGIVQTELGRHVTESNACLVGTFRFIKRHMFITADMGAQTSIYCATEESLTEFSGHYFRYLSHDHLFRLVATLYKSTIHFTTKNCL